LTTTLNDINRVPELSLDELTASFVSLGRRPLTTMFLARRSRSSKSRYTAETTACLRADDKGAGLWVVAFDGCCLTVAPAVDADGPAVGIDWVAALPGTDPDGGLAAVFTSAGAAVGI
jgi:hypothetical protein